MTGITILPPTLLGILLGSYLVKRWNLTNPPKRGALMSGSMGIVSSVLWIILFFLGCNHNSHIAGLSVPYPTPDDLGSVSKVPLSRRGPGPRRLNDFTLVNECNSRCQCSESDLNLVCGSGGITFASPCYAGCESTVNDTVSNYLKYKITFLSLWTHDAPDLCYIWYQSDVMLVNHILVVNGGSNGQGHKTHSGPKHGYRGILWIY